MMKLPQFIGGYKKAIKFSILCLIFMAQNNVSAQKGKQSVELRSPDKRLEVNIVQTTDGIVSYSFLADGKELITHAKLGLQLPLSIHRSNQGIKVSKRSVKSVWKPVWGKRAIVPDVYNEATLTLSAYQIKFRVYNNGFAFRYEGAKIDSEYTEFKFAADYTAWYYNGEHANIGPEKLSDAFGLRRPVVTIKADDHNYMAIHEADLQSGQPLVLRAVKEEPFTFAVESKRGQAWRVIMYGRTPGELVDSHLIELLNPPPAPDAVSGKSADFSWVKPGVALWDWRINGAVTDDGFRYEMSWPSWKRMVDFASENGIVSLVLDADWYGPEFNKDSDPTKGGKVEQVHHLISYSKDKGVGIWLYLNDVGGDAYPIAQTLKQYGTWGAVGIKYGFMRGTPEEKNIRTRMITRLCAENHLMVDFHDDPVHPYGQMRTWPNAVTREFCQAQSDGHQVFQPSTFVTSVFVNMLAGPLDMSNGAMDLEQKGRVDNSMPVPSTITAEAARTLITFSGATIMPDIAENYRKHPTILKFIRAEQMPWQESKTLS
ncbi:MAG TPA: glycoside hydrolase family 97 N-terminal domain-containing protein, partial [Arachidicoccus sp.]|nr:glycoside hydrolase family 97 N-terminal domain-containing protein [Arachidicoccus sp.]